MAFFTAGTQPQLNFAIRTQLFLNDGVITSTGDVSRSLGISKALVVSGPVVSKVTGFENALRSLADSGLEYTVWDKAAPETPESSVEACMEKFCAKSCDGFVAVGGGSVMDTAKLAACLAGGGGSVGEYDSLMQERQVPENLPPVVCAPTTAGTGSEVTCMAVFTNGDDGSKRIVTAPNLCPSAALVDPLLTHSMPPELTASTGMDAFSHAVEAFLSNMSNPISDALSLYAMELVATFLPRAVRSAEKGRIDEEARANMSVAATMAGMAINHAMPHFAHAIGHVLGAKYDLPHGAACSLALPAGLRKIGGAQPEKFDQIARALGVDTGNCMGAQEVAEAAAGAIDELIRTINIPDLQEALGTGNGDMLDIAAAAVMEPAMMFSPVMFSEEDILEILNIRR